MLSNLRTYGACECEHTCHHVGLDHNGKPGHPYGSERFVRMVATVSGTFLMCVECEESYRRAYEFYREGKVQT